MGDRGTTTLSIFSSQVLRRLLAIFFPLALLTGLIVSALYFQDLASETTLHQQAGAHLVDLQAEIIDREMKSVEADLLYLANQTALVSFLSGEQSRKQELQEEYLLFCQKRKMYDQIRYLDGGGYERIRINYNHGKPEIVPQGELQFKGDRYYFHDTMSLPLGGVFISPFDLNVEHEELERPFKPVIRFATPVFDSRGAKRGMLVLNYLGDALLRKLAEVSVSFPGSAWLLNRGGFFLLGPSREDEWGFMLGHERSFAQYYPEEWPRLADTATAQFPTARGLFSHRLISPRGAPPGQRPARSSTGAAKESDAKVLDPSLLLVSYIPAHIVGSQARLLLRRLLALAGSALALVLVMTWYLSYAGALRRNHERQIADSEARLRVLSTQLITAQEDERRRLSRDLHDELGQVVTLIALDLERAGQTSDRQKREELIRRALCGAQSLLGQLHEISARVRPTILDDLGLKDAVQSYLFEYQRQTGIVSRTLMHFEHHNVPPVVSENLYRILQEALTNVARHARAQEVFVELRVSNGGAALNVRDQGVGFDPQTPAPRRLGLLGMRERTELLGGTFVLKAAPGKGTELQVILPLQIDQPTKANDHDRPGTDSGRTGR